jgi:triosephosphate isomerase (TIM)
MIVVNFKTYPEVTLDKNAIELAGVCGSVFNEFKIPIILCIQATDLYKITQTVKLPVFIQHVDAITPGKNTGFISAAAAKANGAAGVLLNHSEHRLEPEILQQTVTLAKNEGLSVLVCVESAAEALWYDQMEPDMIALEESTLIGGNVSIVTSDLGRSKVEEFIKTPLKAQKLVGAGVKNQADVRKSLEMGAAGVLLASGITLAPNPRDVLVDLCQGFQ